MDYILNEPSGIDGFLQSDKEGSASCVANQIVRELEGSTAQATERPTRIKRIDGTDCDYSVSLIGLNGSWGSGKSNLLKIVKNHLSSEVNKSKFIFFEYDFWGHRQDLTRKMFLEELMDFLYDHNLALNEETKNALKKLTGKTTERESQAKFGIAAIFCGTCFAMLPILNLFVRICKDEVASGISLLAFVVFIVFVITLVCDLCKGRVFCGAFARLMGTIKGKASSCVDFEHEIEPSIGKFTRFLANVARILKANNKTLIVVLDNVDRLMPEEVLRCFAAVHILFAEKREKWPSNLKVVVPYDATRVGKIFAKIMDADRQTADDYFRRTFDVVYRLSPHLGSSWESFFDKCYDIVSADDEKAQRGKNEVCEVLDYLVPVDQRTPRKLIGILNEIAVIRNTMKHVDDVRMKDIAVYVCAWPKSGFEDLLLANDNGKKRPEDVDIKSQMRQASLHSPKTVDDLILDGGFIDNLAYRDCIYEKDGNAKLATAAIVYQVRDPKEVSLRVRLFVALTEGASAVLKCLAKEEGFITAFHNVVLNNINLGNITKVPRALAGLEDNQQSQKMWDEFYDAQKYALETLHQGDETVLKEFESIVLKHITDYRGYAKLLRTKACDLTKAYGVASSIEAALREVSSEMTQVVSEDEQEEVSPGSFLDVLVNFRSNYELNNQKCDLEALDAYCAKIIEREDGCDLHILYSLRYLKHVDAIKLQKTRIALQRQNVPQEMPLIDYYLGIMENVCEGVLTCEFSASVCDVYVNWMNDNRNEVAFLLSNHDLPERILSLALRYGGEPYEQKDVKALLNDDVNAVDEFLRIARHYFTDVDLLHALHETKRTDPLFLSSVKLLRGAGRNGEVSVLK